VKKLRTATIMALSALDPPNHANESTNCDSRDNTERDDGLFVAVFETRKLKPVGMATGIGRFL
jgi:hypothetical protein